MLVQTQHRFTVEDYHRMAGAGVFGPEGRVELLDGHIIDMSPIGPFHSGIVARLSRIFHAAAQGRWTVFTQNPLSLDEHSEPEPDIMLLRPAPGDYTNHHPRPNDVFMLIEVADATLYYDREEKLPAYVRAGVPEVWIVNLVEQVVEVYREPNMAGYGDKRVLRSGDHARPQAFPDVSVDVALLLKRA